MALPLNVEYSLPIYSLVSPRTQIEMLESSFEDVFPTGKLLEPRPKILDLSANSLNSSVVRDISSIRKTEMNPYLMNPEEWRVISNDANSISSNFKDLADIETNDDWNAEDFNLKTSHCPWKISLLNLPELDFSSGNDDQDNLIDFSNSKNPFNTGLLLSESQLNSTTMESNLLLDMDDTLTVMQLLKTPPLRNTSFTISKTKDSPANYSFHSLTAAELLKTPPRLMESYTIARGNDSFVIAKTDDPFVATKGNSSYTISKDIESLFSEKKNKSYTITKGNASYTISTPPMEVSPIPGTPSRNSSFSEVAEKFHSLRRSMSSDSVMPLSQRTVQNAVGQSRPLLQIKNACAQGKVSGLSLTTRALVPTPPLQPVDTGFSAAVADLRLRPGRAPLAAKGPMRAMLPLGQMMRAEATAVEPAAKKQCKQVSSPLPASKFSPAMNPSAISTPLSKGPLTRRSISMSPVRRSTPVRSPSSGYGQRRATDATVLQKRQTFTSPASPAQRGMPTKVDSKANVVVPKTALPTAAGSRLKWPTSKGSVKPSGLPLHNAAAKGIPKPVLAATDPNVRVSRLRPPSRMTRALPLTVKGKENHH